MSILCVYEQEPPFPATDQHPEATRYQVGGRWVDALGGEPSPEAVEEAVLPQSLPPHLNSGGLARFSGALPVIMAEQIRMAGVTRVAKGRYRATHETAMPSDQYSVLVTVMDPNPRIWRVTARTATYVEVRTTDLSGVAQDVAEITIKTERVVS